MNTKMTNPVEPTDEEILAAVRRRMSGVEGLVPLPPAWDSAEPKISRAVRFSVSPRVGFAGLAPLVLVAILVVVAVGGGFGSKSGLQGGGDGASHAPAGGGLTLVYRLVAGPGRQVADADLDTTVRITLNRLQSMGVASSAVQKLPPDEIEINVPGSPDPMQIEALVSASGKLEFVPLPAETYGKLDVSVGQPVAGIKSLPNPGDSIDSSLPAVVDGSGIDPTATKANDDQSPGNWDVFVAFKPQAQAALANWSTSNVGGYISIVLDGKVIQTPYVQAPITQGPATISGIFTKDSATSLVTILKYGALPFPLELVSTSRDAAPSPALITAPTTVTPAGVPSSGRTLGESAAPVTLDVWNDYQCPACGKFATETLPKLIDDYLRQGTVKVVYHDFIVIDAATGGHQSADAANAARCAADQGKFWSYQDWLWANQGAEGSAAYSIARLEEFGRAAGLDMTTFKTCVDKGTHQAEVAAETAEASSPQAATVVLGTPTVFVNRLQSSATDYASVSAAIDEALRAPSPSPLPSGVPTPSPVSAAGSIAPTDSIAPTGSNAPAHSITPAP
jgi:protein-disulfide isomerase